MAKAIDGLGREVAPDEIYVALDGLATPNPDGGEFWISAGTRLRGNHVVVKRAPHYFVLEGTDHFERARAREALRPVDAA